MSKIDVPESAIKAFLEVRDSGMTNMFDSNMVLLLMFQFEHYEAVSWLGEKCNDEVKCNKSKYVALINAVSDHLVITATL